MKKSNFRVLSIFFFILLIGSVISFNVFYTTLTGYHLRSGVNILAQKEGSQEKKEILQARRGNIKDRNGQDIAQDQDTFTIKATLSSERTGNYAYIEDKEFTAEVLSPILDMPYEELLNYFNQDLYETLLGEKGKGLSIEKKEEIEQIMYTPDPNKLSPGLPGIEFERTISRVYTPGKFASNLLGFATYNEQAVKVVGQFGIESFLDHELSGQDGYVIYQKDARGMKLPNSVKMTENAVNGNDVYLTIDKDVQVALETTLQNTLANNGAERAWGMVMEVETGKILAWGGYPTFDLNERNIDDWMNYPSMYNFEPGSVMKPFTYAAAIDQGVYKGDDTVVTGRFCIAYTDTGALYRAAPPCVEQGNISDAERKGWGTISFDEGLVRSSNTCIATLLTDYLDTQVFKQYLEKLGFFNKTGIEGLSLSEEAGVQNMTYPIEYLTTGFGQGSSITTLQLMQAYSALFNEGNMVKPYYIDKIVNPNTNELIKTFTDPYTEEVITPGVTQYVYTDENGHSIPVFKKTTTDKVLSLMEQVVEDKEKGTAGKYKIDGVSMVAKTGTGEIAKDGGYGKALYTTSIMAASPAENPKVMMYYAFESSDILYYSADYFKNTFISALDAMGLSSIPNTAPENIDNSYDEWKEYSMPTLKNHSLEYVNWKLDEMNTNRVFIGDGNIAVAQSPNTGEQVVTKQNIFVKLDGSNITMPSMLGWSRKDVAIFQTLSGIWINIEGQGVVVSQSIEPGVNIYNDSQISIKLE